jgi:hypothetical protein
MHQKHPPANTAFSMALVGAAAGLFAAEDVPTPTRRAMNKAEIKQKLRIMAFIFIFSLRECTLKTALMSQRCTVVFSELQLYHLFNIRSSDIYRASDWATNEIAHRISSEGNQCCNK